MIAGDDDDSIVFKFAIIYSINDLTNTIINRPDTREVSLGKGFQSSFLIRVGFFQEAEILKSFLLFFVCAREIFLIMTIFSIILLGKGGMAT